MEQMPRQLGGEAPLPVPIEVEQCESWDGRVIREGIEAAVSEGRPIDDRTARYIASQLHGGQGSALYALASSGAIEPRVIGELDRDRTERPPLVRRWIACLTIYCGAHPERGPVVGWAEEAEALDSTYAIERLAAVEPARTAHETEARSAVPASPDEELDASEVDDTPWSDAARWSPAGEDGQPAGELLEPDFTQRQFNALLSDDVDESIGDDAELGWFGMLSWPEEAGGVISRRDDLGRRETTFVRSDELLAARWAAIRQEYEAYYAERDAHEAAIREADDAPSGVQPRVWVGSLADYNDGRLHGEWFDATRDAEELKLATRFMLRASRTAGAEEWAIMDYDSFGPLHLSEYASFEMISRVANGIAEHGNAFAAWASCVRAEGAEALDGFHEHYRGEWESFEEYIKDYLDEAEFYRFMDHVPESMRGYVEVDVEQIARDWGCDYEVVERPEGGVWVFESAR